MHILLHFAVSGEWGISTSWGLFFVPSLTSIGHISILCMIKKVSKKYLSYKIVIDSRILNSGTRRSGTQEYSCVPLTPQLMSLIEVSRVSQRTSTMSYALIGSALYRKLPVCNKIIKFNQLATCNCPLNCQLAIARRRLLSP